MLFKIHSAGLYFQDTVNEVFVAKLFNWLQCICAKTIQTRRNAMVKRPLCKDGTIWQRCKDVKMVLLCKDVKCTLSLKS